MSFLCRVPVDATVHARIKVSGRTILTSVTPGIPIQFDTFVKTVFCRLNRVIPYNPNLSQNCYETNMKTLNTEALYFTQIS